MKIKIEDIKLSEHQLRDLKDDPNLAGLSESIKEHGQLVPVKARPIEGGLECVFGHRRLKAMKLAGFSEIEAIVTEITDNEARVQALIENTQREDLEAMELANGLKDLKDETGWSDSELSRQVGMSRGAIQTALNLLAEPDDVQSMVHFDSAHRGPAGDQHRITPEHVHQTRGPVPEPEPRADILRKAAKEALTVDQTRRVAERYRDAETPEAKTRILEIPAKKQEALEIIQEDLHKAEERAERIRPLMSDVDYWHKVQNVEEQVRKLVLAAREVEIWQSGSWPVIEGCFERIVKEIEELLEEVESAGQ